MRITLPAPSFNGVAVGQPATSNLQVGPGYTYAGITFRVLKNGTLVTLANLGTDVSEIRVEADGDVIRRITPALLASYLGAKNLESGLTNGASTAVASGFIPFADPTRRTPQGEEATALGTVGVKQLLLVVVLKDPGTSPTYTVTASVDVIVDSPRTLNYFETWSVDSYNLINGEVSINTIPTSEDLFGVLFQSSTASRVQVTRDGQIVFDKTKAEIEALLRFNGGGSSTANFFPWVMDYDRQVTDRLITAIRDEKNPQLVTARISDLTVKVTDSSAATVAALRRGFRY